MTRARQSAAAGSQPAERHRDVPCAPPKVLFIEDVAERIGTSVRTIQRRLRARTFPIRPLDAIDKRHRWSPQEIDAWAAREQRGRK